MKCTLENRDYELLYMVAYGALKDSLKANQPFDLAQEIQKVYDTFSDDPATGLAMAQAYPSQVWTALGHNADLMAANATIVQNLAETQLEFQDLEKVKEAVGTEGVTQEEVDQQKKQITQDANTVPDPLKPTEKNILDQTASLLNSIFEFKVLSPWATTGQQAVKDKSGNWTQVKDPEQDFYYNFFRVFNNAFINNENPKTITIGNHTGFGVKIIKKDKINLDHIKADEKALLDGTRVTSDDLKNFGVNPEEHFDKDGKFIPKYESVSGIYEHNVVNNLDDAKKAVGKRIFIKGVGAYITDNDGNILYFDEDYNTTTPEQGRPLYYNIRDIKAPKKTGPKKGVFEAKNIQTVAEVAKNLGITKEEAYKIQQQELKDLYEVRQKALNGKQVRIAITGISPGVLNIRNEHGSTRIDDVTWDKSDIDRNIELALRDAEELGERKGQWYIRVPGNRSIPIQADNLTPDEINKVLDLVFKEDLLDEFGTKIPADKKIKLAKHVIYATAEGLQFYEVSANKVKVTLNGAPVTEENRQEIIDFLTKPAVSKKGEVSEEFAATIGQYAFHKGSGSQQFEEFNIQDNVVLVEPVDIEDHIAKHGTLRIIPNETKDGKKVITFLNGYLTFNVPGAISKTTVTRSAPKQTTPIPSTPVEDIEQEEVITIGSKIGSSYGKYKGENFTVVDLTKKDVVHGKRRYVRDFITLETADGKKLSVYGNLKEKTFFGTESSSGKRYSTATSVQFDLLQTQESVKEVTIVSEAYGVVKAETDPTPSETDRYVGLITNQIKNQAYKENKGANANDMFNYGLRWTRKKGAKAPVKIKSAGAAEGKEFYTYDTLDQNGNPLPPLTDLQPIIDEIQANLGVDMSDYDSVIGNIYLPGQNIATHRDTTEAVSAKNYPVVVYTIGNDSGINIYENEKEPGKISFATDKMVPIKTKDGTIYTFGLDGKGRFEMAHDTPRNIERAEKFPPITMPNGTVHQNYTITLTFRRAQEVTGDVPAAPAKTVSMPRVAGQLTKGEATPEEKVKSARKKRGKDIDTSGLTSIRLNPMKSTPEAITKAKKWWDAHPLSEYLSYEEMFDVVNSNAWAEFVDSGVRLYAGSNYTVLYHEAFHAFSQHFLSEEDKIKLYTEVSKTAQGQKAIKDWAQENGQQVDTLSQYDQWLAIEELLAEDFRKYAMSDGKKVLGKAPVRNTIFRRIINFLRKMFGKLNTKLANQVMTDRTMMKVQEIYSELYIGNINNYTPSINNAIFKDTALQSKPKPVEGQTLSLNDQDSQLIVESMNGIIAGIIDEENAKLALTTGGGGAFTSGLFTNPEHLEDLYHHTYDALYDKEKEFSTRAEEAEGAEKEELERKAAILGNALDNFGTYEEKDGFVGFHLDKHLYLKEKIKDIDKDAYRKTTADVDAARFDVPGNALSKTDMASDRVTFLLNSIKKYGKNNKEELNSLGFPVMMKAADVIGNISAIVGENTGSPREIKDALEAAQKETPWIKPLLDKLGPTSSQYNSVQSLWTGLWDVLYTSVQKLHGTIVNEVEPGVFEITTGYAAAASNKVKQEFRSSFKIANHPNKYIIDSKTGNILDVKSVLADFKGKLNTKERKHQFIKAIGIPISDKKAIIDAFEGSNIGVEFIYDKLEELDNAGVIVSDVINDLIAKQTIQLADKRFKSFRSQASDITKILVLEATHSGNYPNFSVMTVKGNLAHEYSRMSTRGAMVKAINRSKSFQDLISMPEMAYLDQKNNPRVGSLAILKSLYKYTKNANGTVVFGDKRKNVVLRFDIADGTQNIEEGTFSDKDYSVATASADAHTRLFEDMYSLFLEGKATDIVPADKGTIPKVSVSNLITDGKDKNLYIDIADFSKRQDGFNVGIVNAFKILLPQIEGELKEMAGIELHQTEPFLPNIAGFTVPTIGKDGEIIPPRGLDFSAFSGTFKQETKDQLKAEYKAKGNLRSMSPELRTQMLLDLTDYFGATTAQTTKLAEKMLFLDENLSNIAKRDLINPESFTDLDIQKLLLKAYTVNKFIHNLEQVTLFYGSMAQFKDLDKRGPSINSTGRMARTDDDAMAWVNDIIKRPYAESQADRLGKNGYKTFSPTLNTAVFAEDIADSVLYSHYAEELNKELKDRIKDPSDRQAYINEKLDPYNGMETGDAQGYITFDSYRILSKLTNRWSDQQEVLFQKIVKDPESVKIGEVLEYFPVRKYQYAGPLDVKGINAMAFHKFALMPLIPSVIKDTKLEKIHDNMIKNGVDYGMFQTGSKVSTIVSEQSVEDGTYAADNIYNEDGTIQDDIQFTNNPVHLRYLKDQLDINSEFKNKVIFSTQLRKLIEEGLIEGGVPLDFMAEEKNVDKRRKAWRGTKNKTEVSDFYKKYKHYEEKITKLIDFRKAELVNEIGSTFEELEAGKGDLSKLINFVKKELQHQDLTDHELAYIGVSTQGELLNDLSLSPAAAQIEKLLNAIVNNRLVRQKVNGEPLVQVTNTLFEPNIPNEERMALYGGTKDLQSYRRDPETGKTLPMDVKIALQGKFLHLLKLRHKDGKSVAVYTERQTIVDDKIKTIRVLNQEASLARLNETIQDPTWRADQNNLDMITMVAVRIPVQGHNSMEFMAVKQFLPEGAGSIIIPPAEIVAKSGSDFDVDKLTVMMPSIDVINGKPEVIKETDTKLDDLDRLKRIDTINEELLAFRKEKQELQKQHTEQYRALSEGLTPEDRERQVEAHDKYIVPLGKLEAEIKTLEALHKSLSNIEEPTVANAELLNSTADKYAAAYENYTDLYESFNEHIEEFGSVEYKAKLKALKGKQRKEKDKLFKLIDKLKAEKNGLSGAAIENSLMFGIRDILELSHNFESLITPNDTNIVKGEAYQELSKLRKYSDKTGAWEEVNDFQATRYLEVAYNIDKHVSNAVGKETLGLGAVSNTWNTIFNRIGAYINPEYYLGEGTRKTEIRAKILMAHHSIDLGKNEDGSPRVGISLSHTYDVDGKNKISEVISQLMNGWVDVAKDAWIFDIQGNKQVTPIIDFLLQAGVPFDSIAYFVSNPLVKDYVEEQLAAQSAFSKPSGLNSREASRYREKAKLQMFKKLGLYYNFTKIKELSGETVVDYTALSEETEKLTRGKDFTKSAEAIAKLDPTTAYGSAEAKAAFLHYLELEGIAGQMSNLKLKLNYDTSRSNTLFDAAKTEADLKEIEKGNLFPAQVVKDILKESPIGSFRIAPFQMQLWGRLFEIRNNENVNKHIIFKLADRNAVNKMEERFGSTERYIENFKNDMVVKMFSDTIKEFDIDAPTYKGLVTNQKVDVKKISGLERGVAVLPNEKGEMIVYIDKEVLKNQFDTRSFDTRSETLKTAEVPQVAFMNNNGEMLADEYYRFVIEREFQRAANPFEKMSQTEYFKYRHAQNVEFFKDAGNDLEKGEKERRIIQVTYEEILRDKALDNTLNTWKLFRSKSTIADQLYEIKDMHPELVERYNIVRDLIMSHADEYGLEKDEDGKRKIVRSWKNVTLRDNRVPTEDMNIYYNNMLKLMDPGNNLIAISEENAEQDQIENERVAQFFSNLPFVGFLQSGLNTKDGLSIMRAMPTDKISEVLASSKKDYEKIFSDPKEATKWLEAYNSVFNTHNNIRRITVRRRYKEYDTSSYKKKKDVPKYNLTKHEIPVNHTLPLEFETKQKEDLFDLVLSGQVTARSSAERNGIRPGQVVELTRKYGNHTKSILVRATTGEYELDSVTPEEWAELEGKSKAHHAGRLKDGYVQFKFELIDDEELAASTEEKWMDIRPESRNQLESMIKNNPNVIFVLEDTSKNELFDASYFTEYNNVRPVVLNKDIAALDQSLEKIQEMFDEGVTVALINSSTGYGKNLVKPLSKDSTELVGQDIFERASTKMYEMFGYENIHSRNTVVKEMIKDTQAKQGIKEFALAVPFEQLEKVRTELTCER